MEKWIKTEDGKLVNTKNIISLYKSDNGVYDFYVIYAKMYNMDTITLLRTKDIKYCKQIFNEITMFMKNDSPMYICKNKKVQTILDDYSK